MRTSEDDMKRAYRPSRSKILAKAAVCLILFLSPRVLSAEDKKPVHNETLGLAAYYSFNEGPGGVVQDWSGNHNNGEIYGAEYVSLGEGKGFALRFPNGNAYVDCGNGSGLNIKDAVTVEMWYYAESLPAERIEPGLIGKGRHMDSYMLSCGHDGRCYWYVSAGGNYCSAKITVGAWYHIAATFDGKELKIYVDDKLVNSALSKFPLINQVNDNFYLRYPVAYGPKSDPDFRCLMDEVKIYNRVLSSQEIMSEYYRGAAARGKSVEWLGAIRLAPHVYPWAGALLVEADYSGVPMEDGAVVNLQLLAPGGREVVGQTEIPASLQASNVEWKTDIERLPPGEYEVRGMAKDRNGSLLGKSSSIKVVLSGELSRLRPEAGAKVLNNLVIQLLALRESQIQPGRDLHFTNPRNGWVFLSGEPIGKGRITVTLDSGQNVPPLLVLEGKGGVRETMHYLSAGDHWLKVTCEAGASLNSLVVRSIPEVIYTKLGVKPSCWVSHYGPYDWNYLKKIGLLDNLNVIVDNPEDTENAASLKDWRKAGRKVIDESYISWLLDDLVRDEGPAFWRKKKEPITTDFAYNLWINSRGLKDPDLDGVIVDEFDSNFLHDPTCAPAVRRMAQNQSFRNKMFYIYCKDMLESKDNLALLRAMIDGGYLIVKEHYLNEMPEETSAKGLLESKLRQEMLSYQRIFPDCQKNMIINLGFMTIPRETLDVEPGVDWKVFMDMEFNLIANDPVFSGLYGIMTYSSSYADEEVLRWTAKLYRHYCIEGKRERLSRDPYRLTHLQNPDFDSGLSGWTIAPAEEGIIKVENVPGIARAEGRYWFQGKQPKTSDLMANVLLVTRSSKGPNQISQKIKNLRPGRLYSLRMFTADYQDLIKNRDNKQDLTVSIKISGADLVSEKSFREAFQVEPFQSNAKERPWLNYHRLVFRPRKETAELTISDWLSKKEPSGPIGQQILCDFVEVQPYLED